MGKWPGLLRKSLGAERLRQEMDAARYCGLVASQSKFHGWTATDKLAEGAEEAFGIEALRASGKRFQEQRRGSNH